MFALIEAGAVKQYPYGVGELKQANPNTSFPNQMSDSALEDFGVYRVYFDTPPAIEATQVLAESTPAFSESDQRWTQVWLVRDKTTEEVEAEAAIKAAEIRAERNRLLSASDWTQLADSSADKDAWATYRQALRDITDQAGFPWEVTWPEAPV
jgi:hypothetical protein